MRHAQPLQLHQRLTLELADPLTRHVEGAANFINRAGLLAVQAVAQLQRAALTLGEVRRRTPQRVPRQGFHSTLVSRIGALVGDEMAELGLLLVADGLLERHRWLRCAPDRVNLSGAMATATAISSGVGSRPSPMTSVHSARRILLSLSTTCTGIRIVRAWLAIARTIA